MKNKIIAFIPARISSKRLKRKILLKIENISILKHVISRVKLANFAEKIILITEKKIDKTGVKQLISKKIHYNGTSRVSEYSKKFEYKFGLVVFADEPLLSPNKLKKFSSFLDEKKNYDVWNSFSKIKDLKDLKDRSIVKCIINNKNEIIDYKRFINTKSLKRVVKSVGFLAYTKNFLDNFKINFYGVKFGSIEQKEFLKKKFKIKGINIGNCENSINTKIDLKNAKKKMKSKKQLLLMRKYEL